MVSLPYVSVSSEPAAKASPSFLRRYATEMTLVLFAVAAVTGVLLFFHIGDHLLNGLHEWLGMLFVAAALLHMMRNRMAFAKVVKARRTRVLLGVAAIVAAGFLGAAGMGAGGGNPLVSVARAVEKAPISTVAPVLQLSVEELTSRLERAGIAVAGPGQSLSQIASAQGIETHRLFAVVTKSDGSAR